MSGRDPTIDDVAREAGVARVTIGKSSTTSRTSVRKRANGCARAVKSLGYSVNRQARALASGSGTQIMLIHAHNPEREPNSFYNAGLELGALRACSSLGFDLVTRAIDPASENPARSAGFDPGARAARGIVVSPPLSDDLELLACAKRASVPMAAISAGERARSLVCGVGIDEREAGRTICRHLTALGHRRLGFLKGPPEHRSAALRYDGFLDALRDAGIAGEPWTATGDFTFRSGIDGAERLLREQGSVTALACANDDMAAGAMLALHRAGLEIPSAMSVTGFDDTPMSEVVWPPLRPSGSRSNIFAERAVHLLFDAEPHGRRASI